MNRGDRVSLAGFGGEVVAHEGDFYVTVLWFDGSLSRTIPIHRLTLVRKVEDRPRWAWGRWCITRRAVHTDQGWRWRWYATLPYAHNGLPSTLAATSYDAIRAAAADAIHTNLPGTA